MQTFEPAKQHRWLARLVGDWEYEGQCDTEPGKPPATFRGVERVRSVGDYWIVGESKGAMPCPPGEEATMILTVGYDAAKGSFTGTWIGSMMPHLWIYTGWLDDAGNTLTLEASGECPMTPGKTRLFRDITEIKSLTRRDFRALMQQDDGSWATLMTMRYEKR